MKMFKKRLFIYVVLGILISYAFGWVDLINNGWLTGNILKDVYKSITYYFGWVLIYWWVFILIGSLLLALVTSIIFNLFTKQK